MVPKKLLFLLLVTLSLYVDVQGNCNVTDPKYKDDWNRGEFWFNIYDYDTSYTVEMTTENIKTVTLNHLYIEASVANNILKFVMKDTFKNFIQNEDKTKTDMKTLFFTCETGDITKYLTLNITETQKFSPTFENKDYNFKLAMPITPNQIIESTAMIVTDYNIDEKLTFSFTGEDGECMRYFDFTTLNRSKKYTTKLTTKEYMNLDKSITCDIQVKDKSGLADVAHIAIEVDVQNSKVPNPIFREPINIVNYEENLKVSLELLSSAYTPKPKIKQDNEFAQYFKSNIVANNIIEIVLDRGIPEDILGNANYFVLIVEVEYEKADNIGKTAVLVDLNKSTATTTTSTSTTPECTTTISSTTPCDCSTTSPDPENTSTSTVSSTSETDTSSCPSCPECTTTIDPGSTSTCPTICPECPETSTLPGESTTCPTTCPECPETSTLPGEGTSCPECPTTCPSCPESTLPGGSTTCPEITTLPGEGSSTPSNCDCSTSSPTTCAPLEPAPQVRFEKTSTFITLDKGSTQYVDTFKAVSDIKDEEITYGIKSVEPAGAKNMFEIKENGVVNIVKELDEGKYDISLTATGKQSKSQDEIMLFLLISYKINNCPDNTIQVERLIYANVKEEEAKKIVDANGNRLEFTTDNDDILDWFNINDNYDLEVMKINREDERIKSLLAPQIQVKIKASKIDTPPQLRYNFSESTFSQYVTRDSQIGYSCLSIKNIDMNANTMVVLVNVEDINDNPPVFVEKDLLVVGYPEPKLLEFIAPPYLVKVTATDEDFGDNAKIKYTTNNKNFIADAENGIIFLGSEIIDDTEFKVIAEDNNGNGGNKAELSVKVKVLKQEDISVITIENIAYSEIEDKVKELSLKTEQTVKYLSSTAMPKVTGNDEKMIKSLLKVYSIDEKVPAVKIILYALDNENNIISAKDFKNIADDVDLGIKINVEEYVASSPNVNQEEDTTGWIAAVSTLSVLLALVIIGGLLGYIFYLRPRMMESPSDGYKKHTYRDSIQSSSIETKMESATTLSDRRPTGFPIGFNPKDLDDEEDADYDNVFDEKDEEITTKKEVEEEEVEDINDSSSSTESEPKPKSKGGVKFDTNVTEIEIEIEEF